MDRTLNAVVNKDNAGTVRVEVRGSLTDTTRPDLVRVVRKLRATGDVSHIRVDFASSALIESTALAGLRQELNEVDGGSGAEGVSLQFSPAIAGDFAGDFAMAEDSQPVPALTAEQAAVRPIMSYTDEELLAASDSLFKLMDQPGAAADVLMQYNEIGLEITRRELGAIAADGPESQSVMS
jgi:anti-anti-sigma regulatory factor